MKKSFTLKAFAFGAVATVALAASATPHEFLRADNTPVAVKSNIKQEAPTPIRMSLKHAVSDVAKAPAQKAEANYGDWNETGNGTYTYVQLFTTSTDIEHQYKRREDSANPGNFQVQVTNWGANVFTSAGTELDFTVAKTSFLFGEETVETMAPTLPEGGVYTGYTASGYPDGQKHEVYVFDRVNYLRALRAAGETWNDGSAITDEDCEQWFALYGYDNATGTLTYYPIYCLVVDGKPTWYTFPSTSGSGTSTVYLTETYKMEGPNYKNYDFDADFAAGYFSHEKDATSGTFTFKYNIHDNNEAWFQILTGSKSGTALSNALQELMSIAYYGSTSDDVVKVTESSGEVSLPVTNYRKGQYTILCVARYPEIEDGAFITKTDNTLRLFEEDLDYYTAGTATFTDASMYDALPVVFGAETYEELMTLFNDNYGITLPEYYTVTVPMQASAGTPGQYRLVHPFGEYYNDYLSLQLDYDVMSDYLVFNAADNQKCYILPCATGIYFPTQSNGEIMMVYGSTNQMEGGSAVSADVWGTYANGAITFPEIVIPDGATSVDEISSAISWSQASFNSTTGDITYKDWSSPVINSHICRIETTGIAGVENVAADSESDVNAPVEYFNLQGIRVANPEAGQLLIKRQGNKATKVVIR